MAINWKPSHKQYSAWSILQDKKHTEIFYGGGAGGGKSYLGCVWLILSCMRYKGSRWLMGRAVLKTLKQTTLLTFFDICREWGLKPGRDFNYNQIDGVLKWANGSEIYLKDLAYYPADPEYDSLGSTEYTGAFIDEASQVNSKAKNIVMSRIRYKLDEFGLIPKLLITSNPSKNFLYKEFYRPWKEKKLEPYRMFIPSLVQDNPFISPHYIKNLHKLDPISKQRLLYGNFDYDADPAKLFEYDDILDMFTNVPDKSEDKYLTVDVARKGKDLSTIFYWEGFLVRGIWSYQYQGRRSKIRGVQTIYGPPVAALVKVLEEKTAKLQVKRSHVGVDEDGVGGGVVDTFGGCRGFVNNSAAIPHGMQKTNYANLKSQCFFRLADLVKQGKIGVRTSNEDYKEALIEELEQIKQKDHDKDGKLAIIGKDIIKDHIGRSPDFADALMMRMLFVLEPRRFKPLSDPENVTGLF
jgi:hypothetical protein